MIKFPSREKIAEMSKILEKAEGSGSLPPNATISEKTKFKICSEFVKYLLDHRMNQKDLAEQLGISPARLNEVVRYRIEKFTLDRLLEYYEKLHPKKAQRFLKVVG